MSIQSLTERYRPRILDEIIGQPDAVRQLKALLSRGFPLNVLFIGPPGVGKTSAAECIEAELYKKYPENANLDGFFGAPETTRKGYMHEYSGKSLTASIIENKIKAEVQSTFHAIIFIDEAEGLDLSDQERLRKIMEGSNATFILSCNDDSNIGTAIKSRCKSIHFNPVPNADIANHLRWISHKEGFIEANPSSEVLQYFLRVAKQAGKDMRKAITTLECDITDGKLDPEAVKRL